MIPGDSALKPQPTGVATYGMFTGGVVSAEGIEPSTY
jgi:hypothetical protein